MAILTKAVWRLRRAIASKKKTRYLAALKKRGLRIADDVVIMDPFFLDPDHCFLISIEEGCSLAPNVRLIAHDASTKKWLGYTKIGRIEIRRDSFIGDSVLVLPGVTIGPHAIVGAGSVVVRSIPPRTVAAGSPARPLCSIEAYRDRYQMLRDKQGVYDERYTMTFVTQERRERMIEELEGNTIGFIV